MGIVLGVLVILWSGVTAGFGLYLQSRCAQYLDRGSASFFALSQLTYPNAAVVFDAAIAIKCFGVGVSYLIIIGDLMPGVVQGFVGGEPVYDFLIDRHFWMTAFMYVFTPATRISAVLTSLDWQVDCDSSFLLAPIGLPQVHQCCSPGIHGLLGRLGRLPLC
jgi:amino acid permease